MRAVNFLQTGDEKTYNSPVPANHHQQTATSTKLRLDKLLVKKKLAETRTRAQALILAGAVLVNETPVNKPGTPVPAAATIRIKESPRYVGRGGLKLEKAIHKFAIQVADKVCVDIGASTGGFTDCLIQHGAKKVYAIDVGYGQLHWRLQKDGRVIRLDRQNFRYFDVSRIGEPVGVVVMDVSFISVTKLIPKVTELFSCHQQRATLIVLIKPQFEASRAVVRKKGVLKDDKLRKRVIQNIRAFVKNEGFLNIRVTPSPIKGAQGNVEYLLAADWQPGQDFLDL